MRGNGIVLNADGQAQTSMCSPEKRKPKELELLGFSSKQDTSENVVALARILHIREPL